MKTSLILSIALAALSASAQVILSSSAAATNHTPTLAKPATNQVQNNKALEDKSEQIRTVCINGRKRICGRVLEITSAGLVVDSGYLSLLRPELSRSWVAPSTVSAERPPNLIEAATPGSVCVGLVFLTDIPKKPAVKLYDYIIIEAYPAGEYVYAPVPDVKKTIRRFSGGLMTAVKLNLEAAEK